MNAHETCRRLFSPKGAILIHVALSLLGLMGMSVFVIDYGVLWYARRQAQNTADAAALAGAVGLEFDSQTDYSTTGPAYKGAQGVVQATSNEVFNVAPGYHIDLGDPTAPTWQHTPPPVRTCAPGAVNCVPVDCSQKNCVQVDVYRDGTNTSTTLPVFFAPIFGLNSQGIRATATAQVSAANASGCMRPWFIPDQTFTDTNMDGIYEPGEPLRPYDVPLDIGRTVTFHATAGPSSYGQIDVGAGAAAIRGAIQHCASGVNFQVGDTIATDPGNKLGPESQGVSDVMAWDPDAYWDPVKQVVTGGCAPNCTCPPFASCPYGGTQSPRVVQAVVCDPSMPDCNGSATGKGFILVTNILSFFLTGTTVSSGNLAIQAVLIGSGADSASGPVPDWTKSFVKVVSLVR